MIHASLSLSFSLSPPFSIYLSIYLSISHETNNKRDDTRNTSLLRMKKRGRQDKSAEIRGSLRIAGSTIKRKPNGIEWQNICRNVASPITVGNSLAAVLGMWDMGGTRSTSKWSMLQSRQVPGWIL